MSYRPWLEEQALRQMGNLPAEALDVLVRAPVRICEDPYDRLFSMPARADDPRRSGWPSRETSGSSSSASMKPAGLVRVLTVVWAG